MRENTSSNNVDVKKLNVEDNNEASKTIICSHCLRNRFWTKWFDSSRYIPVPVTSSTSMPNKNSAININETKNLIHLGNFYK